MAAVPPPVWYLLIAVAALVSGAVLYALARPGGRWGRHLRSRFVLGVPWGTLVVAALVVLFYLVPQDGLTHWFRPLVVPYRAWSYFYPLGILSAGFAHSGPSHLIGNLLGTFTFGVLAEYAWSHFPTGRGSQTFRSLREDPRARIAAFVGATLLAGVFMGAFSLGPVIGFSGVVFAYAGFALVRYPLGVVGLLVGGDLLNLLYRAIRQPTLTTTPGPSFSSPYWAEIAIQGHAIGFFLGVVLGAFVLARRREGASPALVWVAALLFAVDRGLWAVYTFGEGGSFVLYRAAGVALLFLVAALVASGAGATARDLIASIDLSRREAALGLLVATLVALSVVAVPYNLLAIADGGSGLDDATGVQAGDYTVYYAEDVPDRFVTAFDVPGVQTSNVTASGAIVVSEQRNIWWEEVSKRRLAFDGTRRIRVGGPTYRRTVVVNRTGWSVVGGGRAYRVRLRVDGEPWRLAYRSERARADPTVAGRNVSIGPLPDRPDDPNAFAVNVTRAGEQLGRAPVPANGTRIEVGGLRISREQRALYVSRNGTRVQVARRENYN
ncbi:rhomboid family intramembrane serine protease [Haloglomus litoreum]|uniref:rhomboid family intramembrane serine protease n=1 Tax=Haloglomus litoreum TaxID=3034026 RepID=UPI0023E79F75|nr:rhomboid family intramembrane serine protease [Haloglomus sp. DT116]